MYYYIIALEGDNDQMTDFQRQFHSLSALQQFFESGGDVEGSEIYFVKNVSTIGGFDHLDIEREEVNLEDLYVFAT